MQNDEGPFFLQKNAKITMKVRILFFYCKKMLQRVEKCTGICKKKYEWTGV